MVTAKDSLIYRCIEALFVVRDKAAAFIDILSPEDYSPEEGNIADALAVPILQANKSDQFLPALEAMMEIWLPGKDIAATNIGFAARDDKAGKAIGIRLSLSPDKAVVVYMNRELAEIVEKEFRANIDKIFGRIIKV